MPLQHLIDYFNQRFAEQNGLDEPPLRYEGGRVTGRFGSSDFTSRLRPVRQGSAPRIVAGYDAATQVDRSEAAAGTTFGDDAPDIVSLDRLARTVHMLNFLPISHEDGHLFVHVHPRHVLAVKQDHGAYFEEIIVRCGLSPRRVAITLAVSPSYSAQLGLLLDRLKNYRARGYATAIKFDAPSGDSFLQRYCLEFLYRHTPDFVRFECQALYSAQRAIAEGRRRASLLWAIRRLDTQLLVEDVHGEDEALLAESIGADLVQGDWYERHETRVKPVDAQPGAANVDQRLTRRETGHNPQEPSLLVADGVVGYA